MDQLVSPMKVPDEWPEEDIQLLVGLFNNGCSLGVIAKRMGKTRNAISGKLHRVRKSGKHKMEPPRAPAVGGRVKGAEIRLERSTKPKRPKGATVIRLRQPFEKKRMRLHIIDITNAVTFEQLDKCHCKFPLGDPQDPDFKFCGAPREEKRPYCAGHNDIAGKLYETIRAG